MGRKHLGIISVLGIAGLIMATSGCTSSSDDATYNNSQISFQYPGSWSVINESENWVQFKASTGEVRVFLYPKDSEQLGSFTFSDNETVGDRKYTKMITGVNGGLVSYAFRGNNSDLFIIASKGNDEGVKQIMGLCSSNKESVVLWKENSQYQFQLLKK